MAIRFGDTRLPSKFWGRVKRQRNGCWHWTGYVSREGYGRYTISKYDTRPAHRHSYEVLVELLPERRGEPNHRQVDHQCHNRSKSCPGGSTCLHRRCVNPSHLRATTAKVNILAGKTLAARNGTATRCIHGHAFTPDNTYLDHDGHRSCKRCRIDGGRERRRAKAALLPKKPHYQTLKPNCPRGHPYSGPNLLIRTDGSRGCRTCRARDAAAHRERQRSAPSRGHQKDRTHCVAGHELAGTNLYIAPGTGKRACRTCKRERALSKAH